jgi:hypothetical protein
MSTLSYQTFLTFMNNEYIDDCHWGQHYDPETETIINIKSETPIKFTQPVKYSHPVKFRELPKNRIFRKKNQPIEVDILETIDEYTYPNDIETGTMPLNIYIQNPYKDQVNYHYMCVTSIFYISHIVLAVVLLSI